MAIIYRYRRPCFVSDLAEVQLNEAELLTAQAKKVMSLKHPHLKMSKSHEDSRSRILLTETPEHVRDKINYALTDSEPGVTYDPARRPGVSNLIEIVSHLSRGNQSYQEVARTYEGLSLRIFKEEVSSCISSHLSPIRDRFEEFTHKEGGKFVDRIASEGAGKARVGAGVTLELLKHAIGL